MPITRVGTALVTGLILLAGAAQPAAAQQKPITFDAKGGIGLPAGDLGSVGDPGPAFNLNVNFGLNDRLYVRGGGGAELYDGFDVGAGLGNEGVNRLELNLVHLDVGLLYRLTRPGERGFFASANATGGVANFNVPRVETSVGASAVEIDVSGLYPSAAVGLTGGYTVSEQVDVYLDAQGYAVFGDDEDTSDLVRVHNDRMQADLDGLSTMYSVPITAGVRLHF